MVLLSLCTMDTEKEMIKTTVRIPKHLIKDLKEAGAKHYRNFNSELIVALEQYLADWKNKH
jgi:metal-responsive CopG/Arc/MetJ family transcriptional regulator